MQARARYLMRVPCCMCRVIRWEPAAVGLPVGLGVARSVSLLARCGLDDTSTFSQHLSSFTSMLEPAELRKGGGHSLADAGETLGGVETQGGEGSTNPGTGI